MRMTRLEWRYLQKIALDHPYFDTHELPLTEKEAKAIVKANIKMTGKEFVDSIYANLGMNRPEEEKKRFAWLRSIGELFTVPPIRKIAIAVLVVILMTVFFAATPTGRAIAESVIRYFSTILDDGRIVAVRSDVETQMKHIKENEKQESQIPFDKKESTDNVVFVDSFDDFITETGNTPVILSLPYTELYYEYDEFLDYLTLHVSYVTSEERIITSQNWGVEDCLVSTDTSYQVYDAEETIRYSYDKDGKIIICKTYEDSYFVMIAEGGLHLDNLIDMLNGR